MATEDWAVEEARKLNHYIVISSGAERIELIAATLRLMEARGFKRGAERMDDAFRHAMKAAH